MSEEHIVLSQVLLVFRSRDLVHAGGWTLHGTVVRPVNVFSPLAGIGSRPAHRKIMLHLLSTGSLRHILRKRVRFCATVKDRRDLHGPSVNALIRHLTQDQKATRQQLHRKQGHTSRIQQLQKMPYRFWTLQRSAGPEWNGCHSINDTLASTWAPAVGQPIKVRWVASQHAKRGNGSHTERLRAEALHIKIGLVCSIEKGVPGLLLSTPKDHFVVISKNKLSERKSFHAFKW